MKIQTRLLLAAMAILPLSSGLMADPLPGRINPGSVPGIPVTPGGGARLPATPEPTGPCMADLGVSQITITKRADGPDYDVTVRVTNVGTETVNLPGDVLGVVLSGAFVSQRNPQKHSVGNINVIAPGSSVNITKSFQSSYIAPYSASYGAHFYFTASLDRGPDAPRCAYDANRFNDRLAVNYERMKSSFDGGSTTYSVTADWAR